MKSQRKVSIRQSEQIGQQHHKKAMRNKRRFKVLQEQIARRKAIQQQKQIQQCTFTPKINKSYNSANYGLSAPFQRQQNKQLIQNRLMKWGRYHDERVRANFLRKGKIPQEAFSFSLERQKTKSKNGVERLMKGSLQKGYSNIPKGKTATSNTQKTNNSGLQAFYIRQARATALKNGQYFYYDASKP